jgi:hypothetical protein
MRLSPFSPHGVTPNQIITLEKMFSIFPFYSKRLCHQLDNAAGLCDLLLRQLAHPPRAHDQRDLGDAALAEDLGVAEGEEVEDGDGVLLLAGEVGLAGLTGDEGPELPCVSTLLQLDSTLHRPRVFLIDARVGGWRARSYLVQVDDGLPEVVLLLVEVPHTNLSEVTRVVLLFTRQSSSSCLLPSRGSSSGGRTLSMLVRWWC